MSAEKDIKEKFREFLNVYWIRPEHSFLSTYDYAVLRDIFPLPKPNIDLACGDGLTSFIWAGGKFDFSFDMYHSVKDTDVMYSDDVDVYDCFEKDFCKPAIIKQPDWNYTYGLDLKKSMLEKAKKLNFYENTINQSFDDPIPLEKKFNSAFSTSLFAFTSDADVLSNRIKNVNKILNLNGKLVMRLHERTFKQMLFHNYYKQYGFKWAKKLDKFIYDHNPDEKFDLAWWVEVLKNNGFEINNIHNVVPRLVAYAYLIGFRPMFRTFMSMYNMLSLEQRTELKKQWIPDLVELFEELMFEETVTKIDPDSKNVLYLIEATKIKEI